MYKAISIIWILFSSVALGQTKIDRKAVVSRHDVHIQEVDTLNPLTLGSGRFAIAMEVTGLQTFPVYYHKGVPLGTLSAWGWDFPMTATRLGYPGKAVDALLRSATTNTYLKNGHNYQTERLRIYLPGNGALLTALAMMAAGTDETTKPNPGFPAYWNVRFENLHKKP